MNLWKKYTCTITVKNRLVGGIPTNADLIAGWVQANMKEATKEEREKLVTATIDQLPALAEERAEKTWTTFKADAEGIYFEGRNVKAMLKECANILRDMLVKDDKKVTKAAGEKESKSRYTNLKSRLAERCFVEEEKIRFTRDGKPVLKPDGNEERAIHVMGPQGPRTALKKVDFVSGPVELSFTLRTLADGIVDEELLRTLLEFGGYNGLGTDRAMGNGVFELKTLQAL